MAVTTSVQMLSSRRIPIILEPPAVPSLSRHGAQNDLKRQGMPASRYQVIDRAQAGHRNDCCTARPMSLMGQTATCLSSALRLLPPTRTCPTADPPYKRNDALAHPQEMPEISVQLGAWIRPPPPHHLSNISSSPAAISGPLRPSLRRPSFEGTRQLATSAWACRGAARGERPLQVHEPRESPAAITRQPLVSAANTAVAIGSA
jgi:hypothetical protein